MTFAISNPRAGGPIAAILRFLVVAAVCGSIAAAEGAAGLYVWFARDLPTIPPFSAIRFGTVGTIRAAHGQVLAEVFEERRYLLPRERIPDRLVQAFLASEDARFFEHAGLDLVGIARAVWANLRARRVREGASTITQQLARSLLLSQERTFHRKIREAILARRIEDIYTKDQILLLYLNLIYLGEGYYGVQAAARGYFARDVSDLSLSEMAVLAGIPQAPSRLNPVANPVAARERRDRVLRRMLESGFITAQEEAAARAEPVRAAARRDNLGDRAPIPATEAIEQARPFLAQHETANPLLNPGGLTVETSIDLGLQLVAQRIAFQAALDLSKRQGYRGPVAHLPAGRVQDFLERNQKYLQSRGWLPDLPDGVLFLAHVDAVTPDGAEVSLAPDLRGFLPLAGMRWAAPYTEFPIEDPSTGSRRELPSCSLDAQVRDATTVLKPHDLILVTKAAPQKPERPRKKAAEPEPAAQNESPGIRFDLAQFPTPQAALCAADYRSGALLAVAGGTDFDLSQVDRTRSLRQIGSVIKPAYYSKAYDIGIPPSTVASGAPFRQGSWMPTGTKGADDLTLFEALTRSENTVSLRVFRMVLDRVGVEGLNDWADRMGLGRPFQGFPAEALGVDATPRGVLTMVGTFAARGVRPEWTLVRAIRDADGRYLVDRRSARDPNTPLLDAIAREVAAGSEAPRRAMTPEVAYLISANLRRVAESGTASRARKLGRPVAGKTGTLPFDVWFAGWTHELAAVMWIGQDQRERFLGRSRESGRVFGADTALPPWLDFVRIATGARAVVDDLAAVPDGVTVVRVDPSTGLLAREGGIPMPHLAGTEPTAFPPPPEEGPVDDRLADF